MRVAEGPQPIPAKSVSQQQPRQSLRTLHEKPTTKNLEHQVHAQPQQAIKPIARKQSTVRANTPSSHPLNLLQRRLNLPLLLLRNVRIRRWRRLSGWDEGVFARTVLCLRAIGL